MNGSRIKRIRTEVKRQNMEYAEQIQSVVSEATISALFSLPFMRRVSFAFGLVFMPLRNLWRR